MIRYLSQDHIPDVHADVWCTQSRTLSCRQSHPPRCSPSPRGSWGTARTKIILLVHLSSKKYKISSFLRFWFLGCCLTPFVTSLLSRWLDSVEPCYLHLNASAASFLLNFWAFLPFWTFLKFWVSYLHLTELWSPPTFILLNCGALILVSYWTVEPSYLHLTEL